MIKPDFVLLTDLSDGDTDGGDTVIAFTAGVVSATLLRDLAEDMAERVGCRLHHADFVLTTDPDIVRRYGVFPQHDGCEECEAGVRRALAALAERPDQPLLVGRLHWAATKDPP